MQIQKISNPTHRLLAKNPNTCLSRKGDEPMKRYIEILKEMDIHYTVEQMIELRKGIVNTILDESGNDHTEEACGPFSKTTDTKQGIFIVNGKVYSFEKFKILFFNFLYSPVTHFMTANNDKTYFKATEAMFLMIGNDLNETLQSRGNPILDLNHCWQIITEMYTEER